VSNWLVAQQIRAQKAIKSGASRDSSFQDKNTSPQRHLRPAGQALRVNDGQQAMLDKAAAKALLASS
jgi:hypothetical protein